MVGGGGRGVRIGGGKWGVVASCWRVVLLLRGVSLVVFVLLVRLRWACLLLMYSSLVDNKEWCYREYI
jgi:hypothetical protein